MSQMTNIRIILSLICCVVYATASPPQIPEDVIKETFSGSSIQAADSTNTLDLGNSMRVDSSSVELYVDETLLGSGGASDTSDEEHFDHNVHENMNGRPNMTTTSIANESRSSNSEDRLVAQQVAQQMSRYSDSFLRTMNYPSRKRRARQQMGFTYMSKPSREAIEGSRSEIDQLFDTGAAHIRLGKKNEN